MNQTFELDKQGGFPLTQNALAYMQDGYSQSIGALTALAGNFVFLSGCENLGGVMLNNGWVIISGEVLPFRRSVMQSYIVVTTERNEIIYETGVKHNSKVLRYAQFGSAGDEKYLFSNFVRVDNLVSLKELINSTKTSLSTTITQAKQELNNSIAQAKQELNNNIANYKNTNPGTIQWSNWFSGSTSDSTFQIQKGTNGRNEFRRFIINIYSSKSGIATYYIFPTNFFKDYSNLHFYSTTKITAGNTEIQAAIFGHVLINLPGIPSGSFAIRLLTDHGKVTIPPAYIDAITQIS